MIPPSPRTLRILPALLSSAFAVTALLAAGAATAQGCPANFFDVLESSADTTAAKQDIGNTCKGRDVSVRGTVLDIAKQGDVFELHIASTASGNKMTVTMRDPPAADLSKLPKGSVVTISAKLRDFTGVQNEYVTLEDGTCRDCGR
jgi:hypothetical protein